jgi:peptidoglycan biosynthesis protein MviN/MurJ (putative lipid II flippase)
VLQSLIHRLRVRWHASTEEHRSILSGLAVVVAFSLVGKAATAAREVAIAWRFGVSAQVDAYLFIFNIVNWGVVLWFSVLTVVLIPLEARLRRQSATELQAFRAQLLGAAIALGLVMVAAGHVAIPRVLASESVGLPPGTTHLALQIVPALTWLALPGILIGLYSTWMMSGGRNVNTLLEGVPSLVTLVAVLVSADIGSLVWGTLLGFGLQLACVAWPSVRSRDASVPALGFSAPTWHAFLPSFTLVLAGQAILSLTILVDQFFAARLGVGAISSLGYAGRLLGLINGVMAIAITRSTLPVFARAMSGDMRKMRRVAFHWAGLLALVGTGAAIMGWALAPSVVRAIFEHGTFGAADTKVVATLFRFGLLQLPFYFAGLVFASLHSSRGGYGVLVLAGVLGLTVKVVGMWLLIGYLGLTAIMIAAALMYLANMGLLFGASLGERFAPGEIPRAFGEDADRSRPPRETGGKDPR